jgi:hypothetical protein
MQSAKNAGWSKSRIDAVLEDAHSIDYLYALEVIHEAMAVIEDEAKQQTIQHSLAKSTMKVLYYQVCCYLE